VLLDSERFKPSEKNETETAAVDEKHDQVYNASKAQFPQARVEYYDRVSAQATSNPPVSCNFYIFSERLLLI